MVLNNPMIDVITPFQHCALCHSEILIDISSLVRLPLAHTESNLKPTDPESLY